MKILLDQTIFQGFNSSFFQISDYKGDISNGDRSLIGTLHDGIPDFLIFHHHYLEIMTLLMIV
jgi:hypothetical protein